MALRRGHKKTWPSLCHTLIRWNSGIAGTGDGEIANKSGESVGVENDGVKIPKGGKVYQRVEQEPPNTRCFIRWQGSNENDLCHYSLLVNPAGIILSWRFEEDANPGACSVS